MVSARQVARVKGGVNSAAQIIREDNMRILLTACLLSAGAAQAANGTCRSPDHCKGQQRAVGGRPRFIIPNEER